MGAPTDDQGRFVWVVTWGRPGRVDWRAVLVLAYDADDARQRARHEYPHLLAPEGVVRANPATAAAALEGRSDPAVANLPLLA